MDPKAVSPSLHGDSDADLSFEALTFGEDSSHVKKDNKSAKKKSFKKEKNSPQVSHSTLLYTIYIIPFYESVRFF